MKLVHGQVNELKPIIWYSIKIVASYSCMYSPYSLHIEAFQHVLSNLQCPRVTSNGLYDPCTYDTVTNVDIFSDSNSNAINIKICNIPNQWFKKSIKFVYNFIWQESCRNEAINKICFCTV